MRETIEAGGNVVIPTFAIERAQELVYHLGSLIHERKRYRRPRLPRQPHGRTVTERFAATATASTKSAWRIMNGDAR